MTDVERLKAVEAALLDLTDDCCGSCHWLDRLEPINDCYCTRWFFPAVEAIRKKIRMLEGEGHK